MVDYNKLQIKVNKKLKNYGAYVIVTVGTRSTYSSGPDTYAETLATYSGYLLMTQYHSKDIDGTIIKPGDKQGFMQAFGLPRLDELAENQHYTITYSGRELQVKDLKVLSPATVALMYELQIRGY